MVAKKLTAMSLLCVLFLPGLALAGGAAANVRANTPPPTMGPETNYMQSSDWVFFSACTAGDLPTLTRLVEQNGDLVRLRLPDGKTGLHLAVMAAKKEAAEYLLNHGSDVNARDIYDKTPLWYATNHCHNRKIAALVRSRGGKSGPSKLYYGDGQHTLYRNCGYLGCPSCYWESVGGYPEPAAPAPAAAIPAPPPPAAPDETAAPEPAAPPPAAPAPKPGKGKPAADAPSTETEE